MELSKVGLITSPEAVVVVAAAISELAPAPAEL